jgi:hypothetical protein
MSSFFAGLIGALVGWALVTVPILIRDHRRRKKEKAAFDEMDRHSKLAAKALAEHNEEAYEFHMKKAADYFKNEDTRD